MSLTLISSLIYIRKTLLWHSYLCLAFLLLFFFALFTKFFCLADISRLGLALSMPFWLCVPFVANVLEFVECFPAVLMLVSKWFMVGPTIFVSLESSFVCDSVSLCLSSTQIKIRYTNTQFLNVLLRKICYGDLADVNN